MRGELKGKKLKLFNVTTIDVKRYNHSLHQNTGVNSELLQSLWAFEDITHAIDSSVNVMGRLGCLENDKFKGVAKEKFSTLEEEQKPPPPSQPPQHFFYT